jgi:NitT/TauT family transport system ATP-binding protein
MTHAGWVALEASGLALRYPGAPAPVLRDIDLRVAPGEIVAVLGPSGVGKSSLLRVLAGLQKPSRGDVRVGDRALDGVHPRVTLAFQDPGLLPWLTLERNVAFGLDFKRQPRLSRAKRQDRVDRAIAEVGLDHARKLYPAALSGGMAQRAALARCLAREPEVLLLDEPFGALDEVTRAAMQMLLLRVTAAFGAATVLITHDIDEALLLADRVILIGGAPATGIGHWDLSGFARPREDRAMGNIRVDILSTLRATTRRF